LDHTGFVGVDLKILGAPTPAATVVPTAIGIIVFDDAISVRDDRTGERVLFESLSTTSCSSF